MGKRGLQRQIVGYLVLLAALSISIVAVLTFKVTKDLLRKQSERYAHGLLESLGKQIASGERDPEDILVPDSFSFRLFHSTDYPDLTSIWTTQDFESVSDGKRFLSKWRDELDQANQSKQVMILLQKLRVGSDSTVWIQAKYIPDFSQISLKRFFLILLFYVLAFSGVLVWFGYQLIQYVVLEPLRRIENASHQIAEGETAARIKVQLDSDDEIGRLGRSIEEMRLKLISDREKLADYAQSLEETNEQLEEAQRALLRGEKLASVGQLASGIAHEVGNPLGAVLGYLSILKDAVASEDHRDLLVRSEKELSRISRILRQLLDYSRPHEIPNAPIDINDLVQGTVEAVQKSIHDSDFRIHLALQGDIPGVRVDPDPLRQVMWNLLLNAADAVQKKGEVSVRTEKLTVEKLRSEPLGSLFSARTRKGDLSRPSVLDRRERRTRVMDSTDSEGTRKKRAGELPRFLFDGNQEVIRISIEDTGPGIARSDLGKIFDPFFTTKEPGKGTGLGLFISMNLIEALGGFLDFRTEPGQGATFIVLLPVR